MHVLNGSEEEIVSTLADMGLNMYEARAYATLLTIGQAKVGTIARKASVPQGKIHFVLDNLAQKKFAEMTREHPKEYRAISLRDVTKRVIDDRNAVSERIRRRAEKLEDTLRELASIHALYRMPSVRLFTPRYRRR